MRAELGETGVTLGMGGDEIGGEACASLEPARGVPHAEQTRAASGNEAPQLKQNIIHGR